MVEKKKRKEKVGAYNVVLLIFPCNRIIKLICKNQNIDYVHRCVDFINVL